MAFSRVPNLAHSRPLFPSLGSKQKIQAPPSEQLAKKYYFFQVYMSSKSGPTIKSEHYYF